MTYFCVENSDVAVCFHQSLGDLVHTFQRTEGIWQGGIDQRRALKRFILVSAHDLQTNATEYPRQVRTSVLQFGMLH